MKPKRSPLPPWKRPSRVAWLVLAVVGACWLALHMPDSRPAPRTERAGCGITVPTAEKAAPIVRSAPAGSGAPVETGHARRPAPDHPVEKLAAKAKTFGRLFGIVGVAAFLGGLVEARRWYLVLARSMGTLIRLSRLPEIVGLAMPTALCSNAAANGILVSSHAEGEISTSALVAGGMANSYLAYVSHSIRIMYPVIGAVGIPGALYFTTQFLGGLLVLFGVLLWHRRRVGADGPAREVRTVPRAQTAPLPWPRALAKAVERSCTLLFRMACITLPLMLGIEWLLKSGAFTFWEQAVPERINRFFPAELLSIVAAQMGGLVQSSAVAANLRADGLIDGTQILLAMLVGSAVGNPFRTLRRNLPSALGIFPVPTALTIVVTMQLARLMVTLCAIGIVVAYMHCTFR